ncbi:MAG: disulfide bond formation protein B, partial [Pseudomonadota bacterium]|nr:disulfide bond formation protein B [Pseudomonadota bacterium]
FGSYFAIRQIWLQNLPEDQVPACGPGLTYIYENFPFIELLNFLLKGDGNCAEVQFRFFGLLSIPQMAMVAFVLLFSTCMYIAFRQQPNTD